MNVNKLIVSFLFGHLFQAPRPLSERDLEQVFASSRNTKAAASEYTGLRNGDASDYPVQAAINELSKLAVPHVLNLQQPDTQDP